MYNVHCPLHLVHGSDPISLRRASPPVHVACLVDDQDIFLKTKQKEIENICRGCRFLMISDRKKLKSGSRLRMSSFREERFLYHILSSWGISMLHVQIAILLLSNRCKTSQSNQVLFAPRFAWRNLEAQLRNAQVRGRINNKQKKKRYRCSIYFLLRLMAISLRRKFEFSLWSSENPFALDTLNSKLANYPESPA